jgi:hypothetical protein
MYVTVVQMVVTYLSILVLSTMHCVTHSTSQFLLSSPLWLTSTGNVPTCNFFITHIEHYFNSDIGGQSMWAGGAISLTEQCSFISHPTDGLLVLSHFLIYIQKNPVLIQTILYSGTSLQYRSFFLKKRPTTKHFHYLFISWHHFLSSFPTKRKNYYVGLTYSEIIYSDHLSWP